jgi:hypothetical protein
MAAEQHDWLLLTTTKDRIAGSVLLNLALVRRAEIVNAQEIKLTYSESHFESIDGPAASELISLLLRRSMTPNGEPSAFLTATMSDVPRKALSQD